MYGLKLSPGLVVMLLCNSKHMNHLNLHAISLVHTDHTVSCLAQVIRLHSRRNSTLPFTSLVGYRLHCTGQHRITDIILYVNPQLNSSTQTKTDFKTPQNSVYLHPLLQLPWLSSRSHQVSTPSKSFILGLVKVALGLLSSHPSLSCQARVCELSENP